MPAQESAWLSLFPLSRENLKQPTFLSEQEAARIALVAAPGEILDSELENDDGVMIYEFEIQQGDGIREVEVDANTGAILENKIDDGDEDEGEGTDDEDMEEAESDLS